MYDSKNQLCFLSASYILEKVVMKNIWKKIVQVFMIWWVLCWKLTSFIVNEDWNKV